MSPDKTQFNRKSAVLLGDHPLAFLLLRVSHAGLGLELVEWTCFCSDKKKKRQAHSHRTSQTVESVFPWCEASEQGLLSFALLASEQAQKTEDVIDRCCSSVMQEVQAAFEAPFTVTRLIYSKSGSSDGNMP